MCASLRDVFLRTSQVLHPNVQMHMERQEAITASAALLAQRRSPCKTVLGLTALQYRPALCR